MNTSGENNRSVRNTKKKLSEGLLEILKTKRKGGYNIVKIDPDYVPAAQEHKQVYGITFQQGRNNFEINRELLANLVTANKELPENAALELDIIFAQDPESVVTLTCPIGLRSKDNQPKYWNIGTTHEYVIDTKENAEGYYMLVDGVDRNDRVRYVDPEGGDASITLKSYKSVGSESEDATYAPLNWRYDGWSLDGVTWNDDLPKWLHMSFSNGTPIKQFEMYETLRTEMELILKRGEESILDESSDTIKRLLRLVQITSNPRLIDDGYNEISAKEILLDNLLKKIISKEFN